MTEPVLHHWVLRDVGETEYEQIVTTLPDGRREVRSVAKPPPPARAVLETDVIAEWVDLGPCACPP